MNDTTFTFRVDKALKSRFSDIAKARDRSGAQLLRDFMRDVVNQQQDAVAHDAWFRREVEDALAEADNPDTRWISNEEMRKDSAAWRQRLASRAKVER